MSPASWRLFLASTIDYSTEKWNYQRKREIINVVTNEGYFKQLKRLTIETYQYHCKLCKSFEIVSYRENVDDLEIKYF